MNVDEAIKYHFIKFADPWLAILADIMMVVIGTVPVVLNPVLTVATFIGWVVLKVGADSG